MGGADFSSPFLRLSKYRSGRAPSTHARTPTWPPAKWEPDSVELEHITEGFLDEQRGCQPSSLTDTTTPGISENSLSDNTSSNALDIPESPPSPSVRGGVRFSLDLDVRVITPAHHPNRSGQFGPLWPKDRFFLDGRPAFSGRVGDVAQMVVVQNGKVDWVDCSIEQCNVDDTYDVLVLSSEKARTYMMEGELRYNVSSDDLRHIRKEFCYLRSASRSFFASVLLLALALATTAALSLQSPGGAPRVHTFQISRTHLTEPIGLDVDAAMVITHVKPHSPADLAGLQSQMKILAIMNHAVVTLEEAQEIILKCGMRFSITAEIPPALPLRRRHEMQHEGGLSSGPSRVQTFSGELPEDGEGRGIVIPLVVVGAVLLCTMAMVLAWRQQRQKTCVAMVGVYHVPTFQAVPGHPTAQKSVDTDIPMVVVTAPDEAKVVCVAESGYDNPT